jgi:hypothetical protein
MKRLCFGRQPADTRYRYHPGMPFSEGLPRSNSTTFSTMSRNFYLTSNKGNMLIGEGSCRIFDYDRNYSCMLSVHVLYDAYKGSKEAMDLLNNNFDALVLPMANEIRPNLNHVSLLKVLEQIKIPVIVLGMGMQNEMEDLSSLEPATVDLLRWIDERALVFGVRGTQTETWLKKMGFKNPTALGCPSMMLYPENILGIKAPTRKPEDYRFVTAGYLQKKSVRGKQLANFFKDQKCSYVFQDEIFQFKEELQGRHFFDDARNQMIHGVMEPLVNEAIGTQAPFDKYFYFDSVDAWRQCYGWHDVFIGDRFHGGVAALQVGLPTAILFKDLRVKELSEFFGVPHTTVDKACTMGIEAFMAEFMSEERINAFLDTYRLRLRNFHRHLTEAGLSMTENYQAMLMAA